MEEAEEITLELSHWGKEDLVQKEGEEWEVKETQVQHIRVGQVMKHSGRLDRKPVWNKTRREWHNKAVKRTITQVGVGLLYRSLLSWSLSWAVSRWAADLFRCVVVCRVPVSACLSSQHWSSRQTAGVMADLVPIHTSRLTRVFDALLIQLC